MLDLGCTPCEESCAQVGAPDYHTRARKECKAFIGQLIRMFGEPPDGCMFKINNNPHDFGDYLSVALVWIGNGNESIHRYVRKVDEELPRNWDAQARKELV